MRRVDGVVLDGQDLALAAVLARLGVAWLERRDGTVPPAALRLRDQLAAFARETTSVVVSDDRESRNPSCLPIVAQSVPAEMTAHAAAGLLGISPQAVRGMCRSGALIAVRSAAGHWRIDTGSAAVLAARRREGT